MAKLSDREFVDRAAAAGHISESQGEECLDIAHRMRDKGSRVPVADVLVQRGYLTEAQVRSVRYGGKVLVLHCAVCGKECRVRGRKSKSGRQCPKCGGDLIEEGGDNGDAEAKADVEQPKQAEPLPSEPEEPAAAGAPATADEEPGSPRNRWLEWCLSPWALTAALALVGAVVLRGVFWLVGVR